MEIAKTLIKILLIAFVYLGVGPMLGFFIRGKDAARRFALGFMAWWLVRPPSDFTLMLDSIETFRGHSRGFEFNFLEAIGIGLALAALLERRTDFRFFPPGLWAWLLFVTAGLLSVPGAIDPVYALMPAFKFAKMGFVFVGVFSALHEERDLKAMMRGFAIALIVQMVVCLWARYVQGGFRIAGWFEHQNPMAMWSYMLALPCSKPCRLASRRCAPRCLALRRFRFPKRLPARGCRVRRVETVIRHTIIFRRAMRFHRSMLPSLFAWLQYSAGSKFMVGRFINYLFV